MYFKEEFKNRFGYFESYFTTPSITVAYANLPEEKEQSFFEDLKNTISRIPGFELYFHDFDYFRNSRTIFIDVSDQKNFTTIVKSMRNVSSTYGLEKEFTSSSYPHMTIAKKLHISKFNKAQIEYFTRQYDEHFDVNQLEVLKLDQTSMKYDHYQTLELC